MRTPRERDAQEGFGEVNNVSIVIVSHNNRVLLEQTLRSLANLKVSVEIVVVDNASSDGTRQMLNQRFSGITTLFNDDNVGFAAANNQGIKAVHGDYILLLNPDTEILEDKIAELIRFMEAHPKAAVVGCRLLFPDGTFQSSAGKFPTVREAFFDAIFLRSLFTAESSSAKEQQQVDWVMGAFFLVRQEAFTTLGLLDEQFFTYSEEMDFCYRARQQGLEVWYVPAMEVIHHWQGVSAFNRRSTSWVFGSRLMFLEKHYHGIQKGVIRFLMYIGMTVRVPAYFIAGLFRINPQLFKKAGYSFLAVRDALAGRFRYQAGAASHFPWTSFS